MTRTTFLISLIKLDYVVTLSETRTIYCRIMWW